ncbi:MAG: SDR family oxidoreductase [Alphaproteobacteria bacterium]|nr:SDR family oxidoreductase [Alphaproteobacteria bacterium]
MRGKVCIVTHVTASIGQAGADALAKAGAKVVVSDASFADAKKREAYAKAHPRLKVTATLDPELLVEETVARHKRVDVIVANASLAPKPAQIEKTKVKELREALEVLAIEPFRLAKAASRHMKQQKSGKIIFVTSDAPRYGLANHTVYCTAQGTANALMGTVAQELAGANVQVNAIAPAATVAPTYFPKEMMGETTAEKVIVKKGKGMRKAKAAEAGALVAFLAGEGSDFLIGEVIPFAGGWI